jgi:hypothetical protein
MIDGRTIRRRVVAAALTLAAAMTLGLAGTATAGAPSAVSCTGAACAVPSAIVAGTNEPEQQAATCLLCWLSGDSRPPDAPDDDDLWQSECDDAGNCQSVPYGGFMDPGPGAPGGPLGSGPRW